MTTTSRIKLFIQQSLLGGLIVLLPIVILTGLIKWAFQLTTDLIQPLTNIVLNTTGIPEIIADSIVLSIIIIVCFLIGHFVSTSLGKWLYNKIDNRLLITVPFYKTVKEIVSQFLNSNNQSSIMSGEVAKAQIFGSNVDTAVTALVTSKHADGSFTVFVPTGPNPTSGNIYHLQADQVELFPDIKVDAMMRTIIACGSGSDKLFEKTST